jgi:hypothetical protein
MVTPVSVAGATARALAPFVVDVDVAVETAEGLLVLTDFPDCFSVVLDFAACCFDAATGFFVAGTGFTVFAGFEGTAFAALFATGFAGLPALFFEIFADGFALAAAFGAALRTLLAALFARGAGFAFFAWPAAAGFFVAIACVHLVSAAACYSPSPTLRQPPKSCAARAAASGRPRRFPRRAARESEADAY